MRGTTQNSTMSHSSSSSSQSKASSAFSGTTQGKIVELVGDTCWFCESIPVEACHVIAQKDPGVCTTVYHECSCVLTSSAIDDHRAKAVVDIPQRRRQRYRSMSNVPQQLRHRSRPTTRHRTNRFRLLHQLRRKRLPRTNTSSQRGFLRPPPMPH